VNANRFIHAGLKSNFDDNDKKNRYLAGNGRTVYLFISLFKTNMKATPNQFNIRVYGLLQNSRGEIMLCNEVYQQKAMTKFPGGGLEFGEGLVDCLKREFLEELNLEIDVVKHIYTTDFYQVSAFNSQAQLISIYYLVKAKNESDLELAEKTAETNNMQCNWFQVNELSVDLLTWPIDQWIAGYIQQEGIL
jgi:8-oxo-dGTP diphosphatase